MVKMLVGQGAAVEQRNGSKLTAYDVATDHVIRQFLLPLQLKVGIYLTFRLLEMFMCCTALRPSVYRLSLRLRKAGCCSCSSWLVCLLRCGMGVPG